MDKKVYRLRAHHLRDLKKIINRNWFVMLISNTIYYGHKAALQRYRIIRQMRKQKEFEVELVEGGVTDEFCRTCVNLKFCETGSDKFRNKYVDRIEYSTGTKLDPYESDKKSLLAISK